MGRAVTQDLGVVWIFLQTFLAPHQSLSVMQFSFNVSGSIDRSSFYPSLAKRKRASHLKIHKKRLSRSRNNGCNYGRHSIVGPRCVLWDVGHRWTTQVCHFDITPVCYRSFSRWISCSSCAITRSSLNKNKKINQSPDLLMGIFSGRHNVKM